MHKLTPLLLTFVLGAISQVVYTQDVHAQPIEMTAQTKAASTHEASIKPEVHNADDPADAHSAHEEPNLVEINGPTYVWSLVLFGAFFAVLALVVWPKILGGLKAREDKLRRDLTAAETAANQAKDQQAQLAQQLAEAQVEASKIIEAAKVSAEQVAAKVKADADKAAVQMTERATAEITAAKETAIAEVAGYAGALGTTVASKILSREVTAADQDQLVEQAVAELAQA